MPWSWWFILGCHRDRLEMLSRATSCDDRGVEDEIPWKVNREWILVIGELES